MHLLNQSKIKSNIDLLHYFLGGSKEQMGSALCWNLMKHASFIKKKIVFLLKSMHLKQRDMSYKY